MKSLNRRYTEALEKSALAEKRLADAEEVIARHLTDFLADVESTDQPRPARPATGVNPPKKQPPRK